MGLYKYFLLQLCRPRSTAARHVLSNRSILLTSNLTVHSGGAGANYLHGQVFPIVAVQGGTKSVLETFSFVAWVSLWQGIWEIDRADQWDSWQVFFDGMGVAQVALG